MIQQVKEAKTLHGVRTAQKCSLNFYKTGSVGEQPAENTL